MDASNGLQIQPEEEREGDCIDTTDYFFDKIGEAVPLKLENFKFDLQNPPSQPLAVSQRLELLFVAHSEGFYVARTKEIVSAAKALKENGSGSSLQELSVIDVPLALVNILALSADSSNLAASSGGQIHIFLVSSLLDKDQQPSFSTSFPESTVKDLRWTKKLENTYIVLSSRGKLYHGSASGALKEVMENVDAGMDVLWIEVFLVC